MRINEITYNNWIRYTPSSLNLDFNEYKKKELTKWKGRAKVIVSRFPIFNDTNHFKKELDKAKIVNIDLLSDVNNLTQNTSIEDIKDMVSNYKLPRDVDKIIDGFQKNSKIPLPIILQGFNGYWIFSGNTRQAVARVLGITPKALLVKV